MEQARPHKRRRGARSCLACRKAKQRCDLPEDAAIVPSERPQPVSTSCHRCKMLKQHCIIMDTPKNDTAPQPSKSVHLTPPSPNYSNGYRSSSAAYRIGFHDEPFQPRPDTTQQQHPAGQSPNSISHDLQIFEPFAGRQASLADGSSPQSFRADDTAKRKMMISPADSSRYSSSTNDTPTASNEFPSWAKHALLAFKPVRLLSELCWRLPAFQSYHLSSNQSHHVSKSDFTADYFDQHFDWIKARLYDMRYFVPDLTKIDELTERHDSSLLLTTVAFITSNSGSDQITLKALTAERALSAVLEGPADLEEVNALILLGLYCPTLLLSPSSMSRGKSGDATGPSLDGLGFFTSAASAANAMEISQAATSLPPIPFDIDLREFDWIAGCISSIQKISIWLTLGIQANIAVLTSDMRRKPFAECGDTDIDLVEEYCRQDRARGTPDQVRQILSRTLINVFRYRAWKVTLLRAKEMLSDLSNRQDIRTELIEDSIARLQSSTQSLRLEALRKLRDDLFKLDYHDDETLEWLDIEISQMYFLSTTQLQGKLMETTSRLMAQANSSAEFLQSLLRDREIMPRFIVGGGAHNNAAKRYSSLLATFGDRREGKTQWSPPPVLVCACAVLSAKILAEEIAGRFNAGHIPILEIDNSSMETAVVLSRSMARILAQYSATSLSGTGISKACDIFAASSVATRRTADAIDEWACTAKSLRFAQLSQSRSIDAPSNGEGARREISVSQNDVMSRLAHASVDNNPSVINGRRYTHSGNISFDLESTLATEDDLDRLLREILSTPIDQYLLPDGSI